MTGPDTDSGMLLRENPQEWIFLEETDSTNSWIIREKLPGGVIVRAKRQTAGRGRAGRTWISDETGSLVFSFCLEGNPQRLHNAELLPLIAGLALLNTIYKFNYINDSEYFIKWPNDIYVRRNGDSGKAAGILIESDIASGSSVRFTVGIGINFTGAPDYSLLKNPRKKALSLYLSATENPEELRIEFLKVFASQMNQCVMQWILNDGDVSVLIDNINARLWKEDSWTDEKGKVYSVAEVAADGRLRVFDSSLSPPEYILISQAE